MLSQWSHGWDSEGVEEFLESNFYTQNIKKPKLPGCWVQNIVTLCGIFLKFFKKQWLAVKFGDPIQIKAA